MVDLQQTEHPDASYVDTKEICLAYGVKTRPRYKYLVLSKL